MRSARPLDLAMDSRGRVVPSVRPQLAGATASFLAVPTPEVPPFSVNGRIFVRQGDLNGYCSGTAINSPTRQLVLTAGHCVNSGPAEGRRQGIWSKYLQFVPGFNGGVAPFGAFIARGSAIYAPKQWTRHGNPDFDLGAFLTRPNAEGVNVADAVGGGATIVTDLSRNQEFQTFGYPGESDAHAELPLPIHRRRHPQLPAPRPADPGDRVPLGAGGQRRRLADRRRHPDQRPDQLPPPRQQDPLLRALLLRSRPSASWSAASEPDRLAQASSSRR